MSCLILSVMDLPLLVCVMGFAPVSAVNFSKAHFGVGYSPYVKNYEIINGELNYPPWMDYTYEYITAQIEILVKRVGFIVTFTMDTEEYSLDKPWDVGNPAAALVMRAAAHANRNNSGTGNFLQVIQGVYQKDQSNLEKEEIKRAFDAAEEANSIFNGTVYGVSFFNLFNLDESALSKLLSAYKEFRGRARSLHLAMGTRLHRCDSVLQNTTTLSKYIRQIARLSDFVLCSIFPSEVDVRTGPVKAVERISVQFLKSKEVLLKENPNLKVFNGETAWPSNGHSYNGGSIISSSMANCFTFWTGMNEWAIKHETPVVMFEAFDEPWKSKPGIKEKNNPGGFYGAEGHYGWWRLTNNYDPKSLYEKYLEIKEYNVLAIFEKEDEITKTNPTSIIVLALGIAGVLLLICFPFVFFFVKHCRRRKSEYPFLTKKEINDFLWGSSDTHVADMDAEQEEALKLAYDRKQFEIDSSSFQIEENSYIGGGNYGSVFQGKLIKNGETSVAAFKTMKEPNVSALKGLLSEIKIMGYVGKHKNIVEYFGSYTSQIKDGIVYTAVELCPLGDLKQYILKNKETIVANLLKDSNQPEELQDAGEEINFAMLCKWSVEIARGMEFLGTKNVIHADLALRNILLTTDRTAKITDFGLSRRLYEYTEYVKTSQELLPWRWMAIESLRRMTFSLKSDVWAFGVTLWEIFALADVPYPGLNWSVTFLSELEKGMRMSKPKYSSDDIFVLMRKCWETQPSDRPTFENLREILEQSEPELLVFVTVISTHKFQNL